MEVTPVCSPSLLKKSPHFNSPSIDSECYTPEIQNNSSGLSEEITNLFNSVIETLDEKGYLDSISIIRVLEESNFKETDKNVILLNMLPEAISPNLYYPWVEKVFSDNELAFNWHIERVLQIDQTTGRLDLCLELLSLGINRLGLKGLDNTVEKINWLEELSSYFPEAFSESFQEEVSHLIDPSLKEIFTWEPSQYAQRLHRLVTFGASPSSLLNFLIKAYKSLCRNEDLWLSLLDLPQDEARPLEEKWGSIVEILFIKTCFLGLIVGTFSSRKVIAVIGLLERLTTLPNKSSSDIIISKLDADLVLNFEVSSQMYPFYKFIISQLPAWEIVEQYVSPLQPLPVLLTRYFTGTSFQHRNWLNRFVRSSVSNLNDLPDVSAFWADLQQLAITGFFGSITNDQLGISLMEALLALDRFELASSLCNDPSVLFLDNKIIETLIIAASQERFDNASFVNQTVPEIQAAYQCLECFPDLASPQFQAWKSFLNGALQLQEFASQTRMTSLTPLEIRLHPKDQLLHVLNEPGSRLYRNMDHLIVLANLLGINDKRSLRTSAFKVAEQRKDFTIAYNICLSILENEPSEEEIDTCISLARNNSFPDLDKRARLVSLGLSACSTSQCHKWLACYRELEAGRSHNSNHSLPQDLFRPHHDNSIHVLKETLESWPTFPFSSQLREHPMYSNEVSSSGDDLYDGTTHLAPPEYGYRLACIVSDAISDPKILCSEDLKKYWVYLASSPDPLLSTLHLLHLPRDEAFQILSNLPPTPTSALQTTYHCGLSLIPYLFDESNKDHGFLYDITRLRPSEVIDLVHKMEMPSNKDTSTEMYLLRAKEAFNTAFERELQEQQNEFLDDLGIPKETFHSSPSSAKSALLESQAFQLGFNRLDKILQLASQSNVESQPLILAHISGFFSSDDTEFKTIAYWQEIIRPRISSLDFTILRDKLESCYEIIEGTQLSFIILINETYINSLNSMELDLTQEKTLKQLELRNNIIIPWKSFLDSDSMDFKSIVSAILGSNVSSIPALFTPLFSPEIIDAIAAQVEQLVQIQAIFDFEKADCLGSLDEATTLSNIDVFTSIIYYGYLEIQLSRMTKDIGLILPDNIIHYTDQAFPHMLHNDLINMIAFICSPNLLEIIPVMTAKAALQSALDNFSFNSNDSQELDLFQKALLPFQSRMTFLEELSELTEPIYEEDLGFFNIQLIDKVDKLSNDDICFLFRQLLSDGISPWLIQKVACLISSHYPDGLVDWHSDSLHGLVDSNSIPILAYVIQTFFKPKYLENHPLELEFLKKIGNGLKLYDQEDIRPWAEATIESIKSILYDSVLLDFEISVSIREEILSMLYRDFDQNDFDSLELLLEWRCFFIASSVLNNKSEIKGCETLGLLSDFDFQEQWMEDLLKSPKSPIYVLDILIIISRYYQISTGSSFLNSSLSKLWIKTMSIISKSHGQEQLDLYALWMFCTSILDSGVLNEEESNFLALLYQHSPLHYYQIGLSTSNESRFLTVVNEYLIAPREDLGIDEDPIIIALLISRGQIVTFVKECPDVLEHVIAPLLLDSLEYPYLQKHALFSLVKLLPEQAEFLSLALSIKPGLVKTPNKETGSILLEQLTSDPPLPPVASFDMLEASIPTIEDLSSLLSGPLLPTFSNEPNEYIHHIIRSFIPKE